jgi:hypothetical protein
MTFSLKHEPMEYCRSQIDACPGMEGKTIAVPEPRRRQERWLWGARGLHTTAAPLLAHHNPPTHSLTLVAHNRPSWRQHQL